MQLDNLVEVPVGEIKEKDLIPEENPAAPVKPVNLAEDEELIDHILRWTSERYGKYIGQSARDKMKDDLIDADRMLRVSEVDGSTASEQQLNTLSNYKTPGYRRRCEIVAANVESLIVDGDDLPAEYVLPHVPDGMNQSQVEVKAVDQQNIWEKYVVEQDKRFDKLSELLYSTAGYANHAVEYGWKRKVQNIKTRKVATLLRDDETGEERIMKTEFRNEEIVEEYPTMDIFAVSDLVCDLTLPDIQSQECVFRLWDAPRHEVETFGRLGEYKNLKKLRNNSSVVQRNSERIELDDDKQTNAGQSADDVASENVQLATIWCRLPIDVKKITKNGAKAGAWDENATTSLFKVVLAGDPAATSNAVVLLCEQSRLPVDMIPIDVVHSHRDNKGLLHDGFLQKSVPIYHTINSLWNMGVDNVHKAVHAPMVAEFGQLQTPPTGLVWKNTNGNQIIWKNAGASKDALVQLDTKDMTGVIMPWIQTLEKQWDDIFGITDPVRGQALGSRTSASEAQNVNDKAMQPILSWARYVLNQILPNMLFWDMHLSRYFADPTKEKAILQGDRIHLIRPAELVGDAIIRVTAIDRFERDVLKQAEQSDFIQKMFPMLQPILSREGQIKLASDLLKSRKIDTDGLFPAENKTGDAQTMAVLESQSMLSGGEWDQPQPDEDHATHLKVHEDMQRMYDLMPDKIPEVSNMHKAHIEMTKQMLAQQEAQAAQFSGGMQQQPQGGTEPMLPGELSGDMLGGQMGGIV